LAVGSGQGPGSGSIVGKFSNSKYLIVPKKRDTLFRECQNIPDRKGEQPKITWLLSIKDGHQGKGKALNEGLISKGY